MATMNPFDLLEDDAEDPSQLVASLPVHPKKDAPVRALPGKSAKLPSKPVPPAQAVRESKNESSRGGRVGGRGYGRGRGGDGYNRDFSSGDAAGSNNGFSGGYNKPSEEGDALRPSERRGGYGGRHSSLRGGRRGGFGNGEAGEGERPRRTYERRSGTGLGNEFKREGAGRGNWGTPVDDIAPETEEPIAENVKKVDVEKLAADEEAADANKENTVNETEEKEPEEKEMTLEEYEKMREEKRKAFQAVKIEERKIDAKEFESMQPLSNKKANDEIFIKLGTEKDKRKDAADKEERAKKSVSINEFLKPAEGENFYQRGGRGRERGRGHGHGHGGPSGGPRGGYCGYYGEAAAPAIGDSSQFPSLGG